MRAKAPGKQPWHHCVVSWLRAHRDPTLGVAVGVALVVCFVAFHWSGAATDNYDARAHLVVTRRIFDSLTPGWTQHGVLWLPLPHLLSLPLVWPDFLYRTGLGVGALSLIATAGACFHMWRLARSVFDDDDLAVGATLLVSGLNPNLLFAATTALTEPLFLYLMAATADLVTRWWARNTDAPPWGAAAMLAAAGLTRYEAWLCLAALVPLLFVALVRRHQAAQTLRVALRRALTPTLVLASVGAVGPILAMAHTWYVAGDPLAFRELGGGAAVGAGIWQVAAWHWLKGLMYGLGLPVLLLAFASLVDMTHQVRLRMPLAMVWILLVPTLLQLPSFLGGHLFRFRYAVTAIPVAALAVGWGARRQPRLVAALLALHLLWIAWPYYPWYRSSLHLESTYHARMAPERDQIAESLRANWDGTLILASMGSLAPMIWRTGLALRSFVHEGSGPFRDAAVASPVTTVGWMILDEGDSFATLAATRPGFFQGFEPFATAGTTTIWKRAADPSGTAYR